MADFAALGIDLPTVDDQPDKPIKPALFAVYPENWPAVTWFLSLSTQWQIGGMGEVFGLNYAAIDAVFRIKRVKDRAALFDDLQVMESAALAVFAEARKKRAKD